MPRSSDSGITRSWSAIRRSSTRSRSLSLFTAGSLLFQFTIGFALALFFNRPFPGNGALRALLLLAWMLPTVVSGSLFRWMLDGDYGVINFALDDSVC